MFEHTFFNNTLDEESFSILKNNLASCNVRVLAQTSVAGVLGNKKLRAVATDRGQFNLNLLGVGISIQPDLSWIERAGIEVGRGVLTNEFLKTNAPHVYACGDVAEFYDKTAERHLNTGNWMNAQFQGKTAAQNMAGGTSPLSWSAHTQLICRAWKLSLSEMLTLVFQNRSFGRVPPQPEASNNFSSELTGLSGQL